MALVVNSIPKSGTHLVTRALNLAGYTRDWNINMTSQNAESYAGRPLILSSGEIVAWRIPMADVTCGLMSKKGFNARFCDLEKLSESSYIGGHLLWNRYAAKYF